MPRGRLRDQPAVTKIRTAENDQHAVPATGSSTTKRRCNNQTSNAKSLRCSDHNDCAGNTDKKSSTWSEVYKQSSASVDVGDFMSADQQQSSSDEPNAALGQRLLSPFFDQPCVELACNLLGKYVVRISTEDGERLSGRIVETEAYVGIEDRASHSYGGKRTARNEAMYMPPGTSYVYNIYGIYTCINISSRGDGTAVLIRALEPTEGLDTMKKNRGFVGDKGNKMKLHDLCNGPSKLTKALSIVKTNGDQVNLSTCSYLWLEDGEQVPNSEIVACSRIGIGNYAKEWTDKPLRFYIRDCRCVSVRCKAAEGATNS